MKPFEYKGYIGSIEYSEDDETLFGKVINIKSSLISYESESIKELKVEFERSVEFYLDTCKNNGRDPQKPMNGRVTLRLPHDLHMEAIVAAQTEEISLNTFILQAVGKAVHS